MMSCVLLAENVLPHPAQKRPFRGCCLWPGCCAPPSQRRWPPPRSPGGPAPARARLWSGGRRRSTACRETRAPWTARATAVKPGTIRGSPAHSAGTAQRQNTSTVTPPCPHHCTPPRGTHPTPHPSAIRPRKVWKSDFSLHQALERPEFDLFERLL